MKPDPRVSFALFTPGEPPSPSALHQSSCRPASQPSSGFLRSFALLHSQTAPPPPANHVPDCCVYALRCATLRRLARRTAEVSHVFYSLVCLAPAKTVFPLRPPHPPPASRLPLFLFPIFLRRSSSCLGLALMSLVPKQQPNIYQLSITTASPVFLLLIFFLLLI